MKDHTTALIVPTIFLKLLTSISTKLQWRLTDTTFSLILAVGVAALALDIEYALLAVMGHYGL
jgi:hypothetical protein